MKNPQYRTWYGGKMHFWGFKQDSKGTVTFIPPIDLQAPQMQNTHLKDKNVQEIYDQDYFVADGVKALIHYSVNHACWFWGSERFSNATALRGEVIGNIYSNPELLTKEQG